MLYLAYGSNMSPEQMERRCPGAYLVGAVVLDGYRLTFAGWSGTWQGGVATIERAPGEQVAGAVFEINAEHLASLDRFQTVGQMLAYVDRIAEGYCALGPPLERLQDAIDATFDAVEQDYLAQHQQQELPL